jgi:hypothetical protein
LSRIEVVARKGECRRVCRVSAVLTVGLISKKFPLVVALVPSRRKELVPKRHNGQPLLRDQTPGRCENWLFIDVMVVFLLAAQSVHMPITIRVVSTQALFAKVHCHHKGGSS